MDINATITLIISSIAIFISAINFYLQQIKKKDRLVSRSIDYLTFGEHRQGHRQDVFFLSNTGNTQMIIADVIFDGVTSEPLGRREIPREIGIVEKLPFILKPGEISLISLSYNESDKAQYDEVRRAVRVFSPKGISYALPIPNEASIRAVVKLKRKHRYR